MEEEWDDEDLLVLFFLRWRRQKTKAQMLWLGINAVLFWDTFCEYKYGARFYYIHEMLGVGLCVSRAAAAVLNLNLGVLLLPMCRSLMAALRGSLPHMSKPGLASLIDRCKGFHILCVYLVIIATAVHFVGHLFNVRNFSVHFNTVFVALNAAENPRQDPLYIVFTSWPCVSGLLMVLVLVLIVTSATAAVRSSSYDLFWCTHRLYVVFYTLAIVHGLRGILKEQSNLERHTPGCMKLDYAAAYPEPESHPEVGFAEPSFLEPDSPEWVCEEMPQFHRISTRSWMWLGLPLLIFACDTLYSYCRRHLYEAKVVGITQFPGDILQLHLVKNKFTVRPGQYILLRYPSVSSYQLHPYTVTRAPTKDMPEFNVHMKSSGDWSEKVKTHLKRNFFSCEKKTSLLPQHSRKDGQRVYVEGPFGSPMEDVLRYRVSICVAGGIGITPFAATLNSLLENVSTTKLERLYLIWINRNPNSMLCFGELLFKLHTKFWRNNRPDLLEIHLHVTGAASLCTDGQPPEVCAFIEKRTVKGRPGWPRMFKTIAAAHQKYHIGVFSCGPKTLNKTLQRTILKVRSSAMFNYYHESF